MELFRPEKRRDERRRRAQAGVKLGRWEEVNKELWLLLSLFAIAGLVNFLIASNRVVLTLY
ncbi:MAG: hypothetical protein L0212_02410, partial [Acidobacteria bacterium]|nr:hypothetical protein [Acidobacteriota bacterium]